MLTATTTVADADFVMSMPPCPIRVARPEKVTTAGAATSDAGEYSKECGHGARSHERQPRPRRRRPGGTRLRRRDGALRDPDAAAQPARVPRRALDREGRSRSGRRDAAGE